MPEQPLYLIVGLGNIGSQYQNTRHNIGFKVIETLVAQWNLSLRLEKSLQAFIAKGQVQLAQGDSIRVILAQPTTYMNLSGQSVHAIMTYYKLFPDQLVVVSDDVSLPFAKIRIRGSGSDGGQKGLRSIIECLGNNNNFARVKVGVGEAPEYMDLADYVLSAFTLEEKAVLPQLIDNASQAVISVLEQGVKEAMNRFNGVNIL